MKIVNDVIETLRQCYAGDCDQCTLEDIERPQCIPILLGIAADLLERSQKEFDQYKDLFKKWGLENYSIEELDEWRDRMVWHVNEVVKLEKELCELKANQPIRCKDCKNFDPMNNGDIYGECGEIGIVFEKTGIDARKHYCSYFEPRRNKHGEINKRNR